MKIKRVKIEGYRSINQAVEFEVPQVCAIIGANNAGKSNILSAINTVLGKDWITVTSFDESDVYRQEYDKEVVIEIEFEQPLQYQQFVGIAAIEIPKIQFKYTRYKIGTAKGQRRLEKSCLTLTNQPVRAYAKKPQAGQAHQYIPLSTIPQDVQENINLIYIGADRNLKNQLPSSRYSILATLLNDINKDFNNPANRIKTKNNKGEETEVPRQEHFLFHIEEAIKSLQTAEFKALEKSIKDNALNQLGFDPDIDTDKLDIFFRPLTSLDFYKSLEIWVNEHGFNINATSLGGGFQNAIVIAILKAFEERRKKGAIFLIEEPEMYLHPQMERSLYKTIRKIGETNQVIYITHSSNFVTIPEFNEIAIVRKDINGTTLKKSSIKSTPQLIEKFRKELDPERNELFFATRVLIVEGDTEKLALPEYSKRLGLDFDKAGASIIEVGGKRNLLDFVNLALSFEIPVGVIYDTDSSDFGKDKRDEELKYNQILEDFGKQGVNVWSFNKNYEEELRKSLEEKIYIKAAEKYPGYSKAIKARLIAADEEFKIPEFITPIIKWLANKEEKPQEAVAAEDDEDIF